MQDWLATYHSLLQVQGGSVDPLHLFEICITLVTIKCSIFSSTTTTPMEVVRDRRLDELLEFVSYTALPSFRETLLTLLVVGTPWSFDPPLLKPTHFHLDGSNLCEFPSVSLLSEFGQWIIRPELWLMPALPRKKNNQHDICFVSSKLVLYCLSNNCFLNHSINSVHIY